MGNYEVHILSGNFAGSIVYEDVYLSRALAYIKGNHDEGRFAIKLPNGEWYEREIDVAPDLPLTTEDRVTELVKWADQQPPEMFKKSRPA